MVLVGVVEENSGSRRIGLMFSGGAPIGDGGGNKVWVGAVVVCKGGSVLVTPAVKGVREKPYVDSTS